MVGLRTLISVASDGGPVREGSLLQPGAAFEPASSELEKFCIFCEVIARRSPGNVRYEDEEVVVFDNKLDWVPVMLLVAPLAHRTQADMWADPGLLGKIGELAVRFGRDLAPNGYRLVSNFGDDALQTQEHAHLHVVGGRRLGLYV